MVVTSFRAARVLAALLFFCFLAPRAQSQDADVAAAISAPTPNALPALPGAPTRAASESAPSISLVPDAAPTSDGARVLARPQAPLFWAEGISRASELDEYAATGMTAVVVRLSWRRENMSAGENSFEADFSLPRAFAQAAARRGLRIIYALPAAPAGETELRIAGDNEAYAHLWRSYVTGAIDALRSTPNFAGWMLPDDARALLSENEAGFSRWILANYADVRVLNAQWLTNFGSLDDVSLAATRQVADNWKKRRDAATPETRADAPDTIWPFHPADLALSHYRLDAYRALLSRWARIVKSLDNSHSLFSGALPDYAQMLALPPEVDVSIPAVFPGAGENDGLTHNPQAVDVARRGNRFRAVAMLNTAASTRESAQRDNSPPAPPPDALAQLLPNWCRESLLHGASGIAFSSWEGLFGNESARRVLRETLENLQSDSWRDLWQTPPVATTAIVLTPLADGYTRPSEKPRGLYGFGENLVFGEPSNLVYALRLGTSFGSIDFLAPEDVEDFDSTGNSQDAGAPGDAPQYSLDESAAPISASPQIGDSRDARLSRYGALLLPQALSVSPALVEALGKYATNGGIVVADLGFGAMQNGGRTVGMPANLAKLFGIAPPRALADFGFNLRAGETSPFLPTWSSAIEGALRGSFLTQGDNRGAAFSGPSLLSGALPEGTTQLGFAPAPRDLEVGEAGVSLSLKPRGEGALVFAPFLLWRDWRADHLGFAAFHGDLMIRRAAMLHLSAPAIIPAPGPFSGSVPLSPEAVNYENALVLVNHLPPPPIANLRETAPMANNSNATIPEASTGNATSTMMRVAKQVRAKETAPRARRQRENAPRPTATPMPAPPASAPPPIPTAPRLQPPPPGVQFAVVQTAGADGFLWNDALCAFDAASVRAPRSFAIVRPSPVALALSGEVVSRPVTLHARVDAMQSRVLRMLPIRARNLDGGSLVARVLRLETARAEVVLWPNAEGVAPSGGDFAVVPGESANLQITIYDSPRGYRVRPNSRHRITAAELDAPLLPNGKRQTATDAVTADALGRLVITAGGTAPIIQIEPIG